VFFLFREGREAWKGGDACADCGTLTARGNASVMDAQGHAGAGMVVHPGGTQVLARATRRSAQSSFTHVTSCPQMRLPRSMQAMKMVGGCVFAAMAAQ
jgi:hypothetical protein